MIAPGPVKRRKRRKLAKALRAVALVKGLGTLRIRSFRRVVRGSCRAVVTWIVDLSFMSEDPASSILSRGSPANGFSVGFIVSGREERSFCDPFASIVIFVEWSTTTEALVSIRTWPIQLP